MTVHHLDLNPAIIAWARTRAGIDLKDAARRIGIAPARLEQIENGKEGAGVSRTLFDKISRVYRQPPLVFYLSHPPAQEEFEASFRKIYESISREDTLDIEALVRNAWVRQSMVKSTMDLEDESRVLPFVGTLSVETAVGRAAEKLTEAAGGRSVMEEYRSGKNATSAFNALRERVELAGVFVILKGDLGNYHSRIPVGLFRGLAISDATAPFIVINSNDSAPARAFTLMHEMVHLLLGKSTVSRGEFGDTRVEAFCNSVASYCLLPEEMLDRMQLRGKSGSQQQLQSISQFAYERNLSSTMVAYRLLLSGRITAPNFEHLRQEFFNLWKSSQDRRAQSTQHSGPSYYVVHKSRLGKPLIAFTKRMLEAEAITTSRAATILDVHPTKVGMLVGE